MSSKIYLDNNATTMIDPRVLEVMMPFLTFEFANATSKHNFGLAAFEAVKSARTKVSELIGAYETEIYFTSGSTESINLAIKGVADNYSRKGKHIITVSTEHPAVIGTCRYLETRGFEITYLPVLPDGLIDLHVLKKALRRDTLLVCVMHVNNETGVIQPIKEVAELTHEYGALFMSDTTQSVGKIQVDVDDLDIDLLCISGHKFYAPKGVGALYVRQSIRPLKLPPLIHGGEQENGLRSGTLNVPGIVALGAACEIAKNEINHHEERIFELRNILENELIKLSITFVNGNVKQRIFNVSNICFRGHDANVIIGRLKNVSVSNGSACNSATFKPSHVLMAMGLSDDDAFASVRFSLGKYNNQNEIQSVVNAFRELFVHI